MTIVQFSHSPFDSIRQTDEFENEFWMARDLMPLLGYIKWQKFMGTLDRAITSCTNSGYESNQHFLPAPVKSTGGRPFEDFKLSRYACYLTAMNGDPRKVEIASAQSYFAAKTREAEIAQTNKTPADILIEHALAFKRQELRFAKLEEEQRALASQQQLQQTWLQGIDAELDRLESSEGHYFTVIGYANIHHLRIGKEQARILGGKASKYCTQHGLRKETVTDSMFGTIGNYPQEALRHAFMVSGLLKNDAQPQYL